MLLLQQSALLLGSFSPNPVPEGNIQKATELLKRYVQQIIDWGWPVRFSTHEIIHIPEDVKKF